MNTSIGLRSAVNQVLVEVVDLLGDWKSNGPQKFPRLSYEAHKVEREEAVEKGEVMKDSRRSGILVFQGIVGLLPRLVRSMTKL
jgi:hypothetical protein